MKKIVRKLHMIGLAGMAMSFMLINVASAHVTVKPAEVVTAAFTTFSVSVPNEKDIATTGVKLLIPEGLSYVTPTVKPGWEISTETTESADLDGHADVKVNSITWSGGVIPKGQRDDFTFNAKVPADASELEWKAYQAYENDVVIAWDKTADQQPKKTDGSPDFSVAGPLSVTNVVAKEASQADGEETAQTSDVTDRADKALYAAISAVVVAFIALILASRPASKKK